MNAPNGTTMDPRFGATKEQVARGQPSNTGAVRQETIENPSIASFVEDRNRSVLTHHNDNSRSGAYTSETILSPASLKENAFGVRATYHVDDRIDAQLLYVHGVTINGSKHNVLYAATMANSVYAFDADTADGGHLWGKSNHVTLGDYDDPNRKKARGILSTPVIDLDSQLIYLVYSTKNQDLETSCDTCMPVVPETILANLNVAFWLAAIDIQSGRIVRTVRITAAVTRDDGSLLPFVEKDHLNRPALLLDGRSLYVAFGMRPSEGAHEYHGWVMQYDADKFEQRGVFNTSPNQTSNGEGSGVWQSGAGLVADGSGGIYFGTGNGKTAPRNHYYGDMILKVGANLTSDPLGFVPTELGQQQIGTPWGTPPPPPYKALPPTTVPDALDKLDLDISAGGLMIIPGTRILVAGGKTGVMYLLDSNSLMLVQPGFVFSTDQDWPGDHRYAFQDGPHLHGAPAFWQVSDNCGYIFHWGEKDYLRGYPFDLKTGHVDDKRPITSSPVRSAKVEMPGGSISISGNQAGDSGIVWATSPTDKKCPTVGTCASPGLLYAFQASDLSLLLAIPLPDLSHFQPPTIADGKVFVATTAENDTTIQEVRVYGLLSQLKKARVSNQIRQELANALKTASQVQGIKHPYRYPRPMENQLPVK